MAEFGLRRSIHSILPFIWLFSFFLASAPLFSQWENFQVEHLTIEDGLSNNTVYCVYQDSRGFMWFGTENGLNRYDGYTFKKIFHAPKDSTSLSNSFVWSIIEDHTGALWIGTVDGLNKLDRKTETFTRYKHDPADTTSLSHSYVRVVYEDHAGTLWVGTTNGVSRFDRATETFCSYNRDESGEDMDETYTLAIYEDREHTVWVGTGNGLYRFDRQRDKLIRDEAWDSFSVPGKSVMAILQDVTGTYWFGGFGNGVVLKPSAAGGFMRSTAEQSPPLWASMRAFCSDHAGNVWGAWNGGLFCANSQTGATIYYDRLPGNLNQIGDLLDVAIDASGVIWTGGYRGVYKLHKQTKPFKQYGPVKINDGIALDRKRITAIVEDDTGQVWLGTQSNGIYKFDRERKKFEHVSSTPISLNAFYVDKAGTVWMGALSSITCFENVEVPPVETTIKFCVDMNRAKDSQGRPFAAIENVIIAGATLPLQWPRRVDWPDSDLDKVVFLNDSGQDGDETPDDGIWSKDIVFPPLRLPKIQYKYGTNWGSRLNNGGNDNEAAFENDHFIYLSPKLRKGIVRNFFGKMGNAEVEEIEMSNSQKSMLVPIYRELTFAILGPSSSMGYVNSFYEDRFGDFWIAIDGGGLKNLDRRNGKVIKSYERNTKYLSKVCRF